MKRRKWFAIVGNGRLWMRLWLAAFAVVIVWGALTFLFWMDSVKNLNALSVVTAWLACAAGVQATLSMRKTDPRDPL